MNGLTRTAAVALGVASLLAMGGAILIQHSGRVGDTIGFVCVLASVFVAALTNIETDAS